LQTYAAVSLESIAPQDIYQLVAADLVKVEEELQAMPTARFVRSPISENTCSMPAAAH
jgi:hypothetical protein